VLSTFVWLLLTHFVYDMLSVYFVLDDTLKTPAICLARIKRHQRIEIALMLCIVLYDITCIIRTYYRTHEPEYFNDHKDAFLMSVKIASTVRVLIDVYLYTLLAFLMSFFYRKKRESLDY